MKKIFILSITIFIATNTYGMQPATPAPAFWQQWAPSWLQYHWQNIQNIYNKDGFGEVCKTYPITTLVLTAGLACGAYFGYNSIFGLESRLMRAIEAGDQTTTASILTELESNVTNARRQPNFEQTKKDALDLCDKAFRKNNENENKPTHSGINDAIGAARIRIANIDAETPRSGTIRIVTDNDEDEYNDEDE